jgi:hypothetical protein
LELILLGLDEAIITAYFITNYSKSKDKLDYTVIKTAHLTILLNYIKTKNNSTVGWALGLLKIICHYRKDLTSLVNEELKKVNGIIKASLLYTITDKNKSGKVYEALSSLLTIKQLSKEPTQLLSSFDLDWIGHETLLVDLLKLRNIELAENICDALYMSYIGDKPNQLNLPIGDINWWLEWLSETSSQEKNWSFNTRISFVISTFISKEQKQLFINEFNNPSSKYHGVLKNRILINFSDLSLKDLNENAISYLIMDLKEHTQLMFGGNLLEKIATESFVKERLLPLMKIAKGKFSKNLSTILTSLGERHGRRYIFH